MQEAKLKLAILVALVIAVAVSGCGPTQAQEEAWHPAATANVRCAEHDGVETISVDKYGNFAAATCKDGTAIEIGE